MASATVFISVGWAVATESWVSKPPSETKNTWRFAPSLGAAPIIFATIFNWSPRLFGVGKAVARAGVLARALVNTLSASTERLATRLYSASSKCVRGWVIRVRSASVAALEPNRLDFKPFSGTEPLVDTWYCTAELPDMKTALPDTFTHVNVELPLPDSKMSPMRPPQPDSAPSGADACQVDCWSLCENSLAGSLTDLLLYCALVVGWIRVPMLSSTPSWPPSNSGIRGARLGASAYWWATPRLSSGACSGFRAVAARLARAWAKLGRMAW